MSKCAHCGAEISPDIYLCPQCGSALEKKFSAANLASFGFFVALCAFFFAVPFALLRVGTSLSPLAVTLISIPAVAALFYIAVKWAELG